MAIPIRHTRCGEVAMWYVGERGESRALSSDIVYLDGTYPEFCSTIPDCPHCGDKLNPRNIVRCFDESIDPGFDMQEVLKDRARSSPPPVPGPVTMEALVRKINIERMVMIGLAVVIVCCSIALMVINQG